MQQHSTFLVQSLFFLLVSVLPRQVGHDDVSRNSTQVLVENVTLAVVPLVAGEPNRAFACLGAKALAKCVFLVICLCAASWGCHIMYYKVIS